MTAVELLSKVPMFKELSEGHRKSLSSVCKIREVKRGSQIFLDGDPAEGFYSVCSGLIKIFKLGHDGKEQILHIFGDGEIFGEVPVFSGGAYPANAVTLEKSLLLFFPKDDFIGLIQAEPQIALNMLAVMSFRLRRFAHLIENLSLKEVPGRLAAYILYLCDEKPGESGVRLEISKGHLASVLGTIPETLSRIFNRLSAQGFIEVSGRDIRVINRKALEDVAAGFGQAK